MPEDQAPARVSGPFGTEIFTVSALNRSVRDLLEHRFPLLWVAGEISNFTAARSGHWYFSLKDDAAQVRCVMFRHRGQYLDFTPRDGMRVEARALVTLYEPRGDFQLNVEFLRQAGLGALHEAFLRLRDKLEREGVFDPASKRPLPSYPRAIGVVTSPAAAALRDVLTTLARRNPAIPVVVYPTQVQGDAAPAQIVAAIAAAGRRAECDVLILCRGGGSIEDLWAFNDERVARAIRACPIPVVVGVGHETDFTIADFAADRRAPTPTAAAEIASPARDELLARIGLLGERLHRRVVRDIETRVQLLDHLSRRLVHPGRRLAAQTDLIRGLELRLLAATRRAVDRESLALAALRERLQRLLPPIAAQQSRIDQLALRLRAALDAYLVRATSRTESAARGLAHLDPQAVLERGYGIVRDAAGAIVRDAATLAVGDRLGITLARGAADVRVEGTRRSDK